MILMYHRSAGRRPPPKNATIIGSASPASYSILRLYVIVTTSAFGNTSIAKINAPQKTWKENIFESEILYTCRRLLPSNLIYVGIPVFSIPCDIHGRNGEL